MGDTLRVGVVGAGIGAGYIAGFQKQKDVEVVAVSARTLSRVEPLAERSLDDSSTGKTNAFADATVRQFSPQFGSETTVADQEPTDDTSLLVSSEAHLS